MLVQFLLTESPSEPLHKIRTIIGSDSVVVGHEHLQTRNCGFICNSCSVLSRQYLILEFAKRSLDTCRIERWIEVNRAGITCAPELNTDAQRLFRIKASAMSPKPGMPALWDEILMAIAKTAHQVWPKVWWRISLAVLWWFPCHPIGGSNTSQRPGEL